MNQPSALAPMRPTVLRIAHVGQAGNQRGEDQRGDDHLDQAQEDVGQDAEVAGDFLGRGRAAGARLLQA